MARRVSWTNNSSGHLGTYVYRAPALDPQNLPAPVATVDPVAQGATAEWIDDFTGYECYAVQDFDGQGLGTLSAETCISDPFASAQIGDEIGGGIYAGIYTGADSIQYHFIVGKDASTAGDLQWKTANSFTSGASNLDDGWVNTQAMVAAGIANHPAAQHCVNYTGGGHNDWFMPARRAEFDLIAPLFESSHPEFPYIQFSSTWTSSQDGSFSAFYKSHSSFDNNYSDQKVDSDPIRFVRPVRRVPV